MYTEQRIREVNGMNAKLIAAILSAVTTCVIAVIEQLED